MVYWCHTKLTILHLTMTATNQQKCLAKGLACVFVAKAVCLYFILVHLGYAGVYLCNFLNFDSKH